MEISVQGDTPSVGFASRIEIRFRTEKELILHVSMVFIPALMYAAVRHSNRAFRKKKKKLIPEKAINLWAVSRSVRVCVFVRSSSVWWADVLCFPLSEAGEPGESISVPSMPPSGVLNIRFNIHMYICPAVSGSLQSLKYWPRVITSLQYLRFQMLLSALVMLLPL